MGVTVQSFTALKNPHLILLLFVVSNILIELMAALSFSLES